MAKKPNTNSTGILGWIDERFPLSSFIKNHLTEYYAPKNFNFWYFFGALALVAFVPARVLRGPAGLAQAAAYWARAGLLAGPVPRLKQVQERRRLRP